MLPAPCYVISDLHIGAAPAEVERQLLQFLEMVRHTGGSLVVNGDLFDFWFEWRTVIPRIGFRSLAALAAVRESGVPLLWLQGNHDGWGAAVLREDVGAEYCREWRGRLAGWNAWVHHGDGLRPEEDRHYRRTLRVLRHPLSIRAFRFLHPDVGSRMAHSSSAHSRRRGRHDEGAGLQAVALRELEGDPRLELVILAHSHVASLVRAPGGGVYANSGTWLQSPTYLRITPERVELRRFDGSAEGERLDALDRRTEEALAQP